MSLAQMQVNSVGWSHGRFKRKNSSDQEDDDCDMRKKSKYSWYVTLESDSPLPTDDENESVHSFQDNETEYVRDTSDTSTHTWVSGSDNEDMSVHVEYEVASLSENEDPFPDDCTSSDPEDIVTMGVIAAICDSDLGLADDSNDSRSSVDSEIGKADYWTCIQCNARNNNPLFRYCEKCYQIRKNFFPPRPKWKRRRRKDGNKLEIISSKASEEIKGQELRTTDSGFASSQESKYSMTLDLDSDIVNNPGQSITPTSVSSSSFSRDSVDFVESSFASVSSIFKQTLSMSSQEKPRDMKVADHSSKDDSTSDNVDSEDRNISSNQIPVPCEVSKISPTSSSLSDNRSDLDTESTGKTCLTCELNPKNGAFVHGSTLHICCCYQCAFRIWRTTKQCPICNRKITNVLKAFYV